MESQNKGWGFWGTLEAAGHEPAVAWSAAMQQIVVATNESAESVRVFLDSVRGRHFADSVINGLRSGDVESAIRRAVAQWMGWRVGKQEARQEGIPHGEPCLRAYVVQAGIMLDCAD